MMGGGGYSPMNGDGLTHKSILNMHDDLCALVYFDGRAGQEAIDDNGDSLVSIPNDNPWMINKDSSSKKPERSSSGTRWMLPSKSW